MRSRGFVGRLHHLWQCRAEYTLLKRQRHVIADALAAQAPTKISAQHIALMRALRVRWVPVESGAPGLRQFFPFGESRSTRGIGFDLLGIRDEALLARTMVELGQLIPSLCARATLPPGTYRLPADMREYFAAPETGVSPNGDFALLSEHIVMLRQFCWRTEMLDQPCWPLPYVDGKRPYGDCSYFQIDMASHLGTPYTLQSNGEVMPDPIRDAELENLHLQMLTALQVLLQHAKPSDQS